MLLWSDFRFEFYFLCFTRTSSSWSHQAKSGPLQPGLSNAYAVVPSDGDRPPPHLTLFSEERHWFRFGGCSKPTTASAEARREWKMLTHSPPMSSGEDCG